MHLVLSASNSFPPPVSDIPHTEACRMRSFFFKPDPMPSTVIQSLPTSIASLVMNIWSTQAFVENGWICPKLVGALPSFSMNAALARENPIE